MTLKRYDAVVNGTATILLLNAEDAAALGDAVTKYEKAAAPAGNKARKPANKAAAPAGNKAPEAPVTGAVIPGGSTPPPAAA